MNLDRKQLETIDDETGWRTTGSIWNLLGIIVSHFQCVGFQPENQKIKGRILA